MFARLWCLHDAEPRSGPLNMAFDELMLEHAAITGRAVLRTYQWSEPFVSIGYFDRIDQVESQFPHRVLVRRWTGGGAVDHADDFTFTLAIPSVHASARWPAAKRYAEIHAQVSSALARLGVATESVRRARGVLAGAGPAPCFTAPVFGDLMLNGRKLVGGAQRRTRIGVLHQGSLQPVPPRVARKELAGALAEAFGQNLQRFELDAAILRRAESLAREKYASPAWLRSR